MFSKINSDGLVYISPEIEQILMRSEGFLCASFTSGGDNNGIDDLLPGEDWGGDLL